MNKFFFAKKLQENSFSAPATSLVVVVDRRRFFRVGFIGVIPPSGHTTRSADYPHAHTQQLDTFLARALFDLGRFYKPLSCPPHTPTANSYSENFVHRRPVVRVPILNPAIPYGSRQQRGVLFSLDNCD